MKLKVFNQSPIIWNIILFVFLSLFFVIAQELAYTNNSVFDMDFLRSMIVRDTAYLFLSCSVFLFVYKFKKIGATLFLIQSLYTVFLTLFNLYGEFSKIILVILFIYFVVFYCLYHLFIQELKDACFNPLVTSEDLFDFKPYEILCSIEVGDKNIDGYLTNWSKTGGFIILKDNSLEGTGQQRGKLKIMYKDKSFSEVVEIVSEGLLAGDCSRVGLGFKANNKRTCKKELGWTAFYEIIVKMGFSPEL